MRTAPRVIRPAVLAAAAALLLALGGGCSTAPPVAPGIVLGGRYDGVRREMTEVVRREMQGSRLVGLALGLALEAKIGKAVTAAPAAPRPPQEVPLAPADLAALPGYYASELGLLTLSARRGELWSRLQGNDLKLVGRPEHRFSMQFRLLGVIPLRIPSLDTLELGFPTVAGRSLVVAYVGGNAVILGEKVAPGPIPAAWEKRLGTWKPLNTDGAGDWMLPAVLRQEGPFLVFETRRREVGTAARALTPLTDTEALTAGTGRGMGETLWVKTVGGEEHLMFSGYELRRGGE